MTGKLAISKSGHDKHKLYVIVSEDKEYVYLADGVIKSVSKPKKKNKKHIQIISHIPAEVEEVLKTDNGFRDLDIKRAIKLYGNA